VLALKLVPAIKARYLTDIRPVRYEQQHRHCARFLEVAEPNKILPSRYFQDELFNRRNRIAHWGYVNSTRQEAEHSHQIAVVIITILRHEKEHITRSTSNDVHEQNSVPTVCLIHPGNTGDGHRTIA
jgi:hypothetical protein